MQKKAHFNVHFQTTHLGHAIKTSFRHTVDSLTYIYVHMYKCVYIFQSYNKYHSVIEDFLFLLLAPLGKALLIAHYALVFDIYRK